MKIIKIKEKKYSLVPSPPQIESSADKILTPTKLNPQSDTLHWEKEIYNWDISCIDLQKRDKNNKKQIFILNKIAYYVTIILLDKYFLHSQI